MKTIYLKLKKLFTETDMSWKRVLTLSVLCGLIPGVLMIPEFLSGTSFQQPGISFEFWIFAALFIILNCEKAVEAGLKTFVFFLISQPLIYLVQVPFAQLHWQIFSYYPRWGFLTLLTLPGGMIAWLLKKQKGIVGVLILSVANLILCYELPTLVHSMLIHFPGGLLTVLFVIFELIFFTLLLFEDKRQRLVSFVIAAVLLIGFTAYDLHQTVGRSAVFTTQLPGEAPFEIIGGTGDMEVSTDGNTLSVKADFYCTMPIDLRDANGHTFTVNFSYGENGVAWTVDQ